MSRRRRRDPDALIAACLALLVIAGVALGIWLKVRHDRWVAACRRDGGHIEQVNCRTMQDESCYTVDFGGGNATTWCQPSGSHQECDERCAGLPAERPAP